MKKSSQEIVLNSGRKVTKFSLENDKGMQVEVLSLGATLIKVMVPDKDEKLENVVLGWQDINVYEAHPGNFGAIIGRVAGRIYKGEITLDGKSSIFLKIPLEIRCMVELMDSIQKTGKVHLKKVMRLFH